MEWRNAVVGMVSCSSKGVVDDYPLIKKKNEDGNGRQLQTGAGPDQSKARARAAVMKDDTHRIRPWPMATFTALYCTRGRWPKAAKVKQ
jgi:hypothetical protein